PGHAVGRIRRPLVTHFQIAVLLNWARDERALFLKAGVRSQLSGSLFSSQFSVLSSQAHVGFDISSKKRFFASFAIPLRTFQLKSLFRPGTIIPGDHALAT